MLNCLRQIFNTFLSSTFLKDISCDRSFFLQCMNLTHDTLLLLNKEIDLWKLLIHYAICYCLWNVDELSFSTSIPFCSLIFESEFFKLGEVEFLTKTKKKQWNTKIHLGLILLQDCLDAQMLRLLRCFSHLRGFSHLTITANVWQCRMQSGFL